MAHEHEAHAHRGHGVTTSEQWNAMWAEHGSEPWSGGPDSLLPPEVAVLSPGRALDVGCGDGGNAIWLAEQGWTARGIDFAAAAIERARAHAVARGVDVEFAVADAAEYAPGERFDLVTMFYVHPPTGALANAASLLAPGGVLLFVGHDRSDPEMHGKHLDPADLTTVDEVVALLAGLEIERADVVEHEIAFSEERVPAVSTVVKARRPATG